MTTPLARVALFELGEACRQLSLLTAQQLELFTEPLDLATAASPHVAQHLTDPPANATVQIAFELTP